jgi:hypothetical protein
MPRYRSSLRATALLLASGALLVVGAVAAPAGAHPKPERGPKPGEAPPLPAVESAVTFAEGPDYATAPDGTIYSPLDEPDVILGHDNGQSTLYDNGKGLRFSYWSFGDTGLTQPNGDGKNFLGNTAARTTDLDMSDNVSEWLYDGGPDGPREAWRLTAEEEAWNATRRDTDPNTPGCQPGPGITWMECGDEYAIWGSGIVADPKNKRIVAFYNLIKRYHAKAESRPDPDNPGQTLPCTDEDIENRVEACRVFLFDGVGQGVAIWTEDLSDGDDWERMTITNATDPSKPTALWPYDDDPTTPDTRFDNAFFRHGNYLYAYGCPGFLATQCQVSRVSLARPGDVYDRAAWRFYAGKDRDRSRCPTLWSPDVACAAALKVDTDGGPEESLGGGAAGTSVFWNPALKVFMWIYSQPLSNEIRYRVAYAPEGPWSRSELLGMALPAAGTGLGSVSYAGFAHPEYAERNGLVQYITYAHTTGFLRGDLPIMKVTFREPRR